MATDNEEPSAGADPQVRPVRPAERRPRRAGLDGSVLCLFDGSTEAAARLLVAAASAAASGRRLIVAHVESAGNGFWAAAFTGYGACIGPAERLVTSNAEGVFAAAVECLLDLPTGWDFASCRGGSCRSLRRLARLHDSAVVVVPRRRRLVRRLRDDRRFTLLVLD